MLIAAGIYLACVEIILSHTKYLTRSFWQFDDVFEGVLILVYKVVFEEFRSSAEKIFLETEWLLIGTD